MSKTKNGFLVVEKKDIQVHMYKSVKIRVAYVKKQLCFVANDIAKVMVFGGNRALNIRAVLGDNDDMCAVRVRSITPGNKEYFRLVNFITKRGIDRLVEAGKDKIEDAYQFQLWVNRLMGLADDDGMVISTTEVQDTQEDDATPIEDESIQETITKVEDSAITLELPVEAEEDQEATQPKSILQPFLYKSEYLIRTTVIDGEPWFVAKDVCDVLGLSNPTEALRSLDEDERNTLRISEGIRGNPMMTVISESGLYALIFRSNKPEAKQFSRWVRHDVLPSINRTGTYMTPEATARLEAHEQAIQEQIGGLEEEIRELRYDVAFRSSSTTSNTNRITDPAQLKLKATVTIGQLVTVLNAVESPVHNVIERDDMFTWLRNHGYLSSDPDSYNQPTLIACRSAFFTKRLTHYTDPESGEDMPYWQAICTNRGMRYLIKLRKEGEEFLPMEDWEVEFWNAVRRGEIPSIDSNDEVGDVLEDI